MVPLQDSQIKIDTSAVAGFFGGEESLSGMATMHLYEGHAWFGWYNNPGSFVMARRFGELFSGLYKSRPTPGEHKKKPPDFVFEVDPNTLFKFDHKEGPQFCASQSSTYIKDTGYASQLFLAACKRLDEIVVPGRSKRRIGVTIADLDEVPPAESSPRLQRRWSRMMAILPIIVSVGGCVSCGYFEDWYCFSLILLGIVSSGLSSLVMGAGDLRFVHPWPSPHAPKGDGILISESEVVVLRGNEGAVTPVTRGRFSVRFTSRWQCYSIRVAVFLLATQFLLQLLFVPQGTVFGQIVFLATLGVSWTYHSYLFPPIEMVQRKLLFDILKLRPSMLTKFSLGTRTQMAVFVLLTLRPNDPAKILDMLLPNDTKIWKKWKSAVLDKLKEMEQDGGEFSFEDSDGGDENGKETQLLKTLLGDATDAYRAYLDLKGLKEKPLSV
jgi:hypothetical protein